MASNLPDIDVAVFPTDTLPCRSVADGRTASLAQVVLPLALAGAMSLVGTARRPRTSRRRGSCRTGAAVLCGAVLSHIFLDFLNSYGVRLLMPFSQRWFYGDALYIVDPWLYVLLGGGVWLACAPPRRGLPRPRRPARVGLALAAVYMLAMLASNLWARAVVAEGWPARAGRRRGSWSRRCSSIRSGARW